MDFEFRVILVILLGMVSPVMATPNGDAQAGAAFFERRVRPILVEHCYSCHSEVEDSRKGGLLLDRESGWLDGGDSGKAVIPGNLAGSLLITAVRYGDEDYEMPPKYQLETQEVAVLEEWVKRGAPGPAEDMGDTEFSQLGDQELLSREAREHWAFQPVAASEPPRVSDGRWNGNAIDRFVYAKLKEVDLAPSSRAEERDLVRRLYFDLTGLPPDVTAVRDFDHAEVGSLVDKLLEDTAFGEKWARHWLDVARYADTDLTYRFDTESPKYFPFAFTYRNYVIDSFNLDKPIHQFIREQLAADLMTERKDAPELAALGFIGIGPHLNNREDYIDDVIDTTTRGFMAVTAACARCHDHKYEAIPTEDYYSLHGIFSSVTRPQPTRIEEFPVIAGYERTPEQLADYQLKLAEIKKEIKASEGKSEGPNKRSVVQKLEDTKQAELVMNHEGAPPRATWVKENREPKESPVYIRGDRTNRGKVVPRRFLRLLDPEQETFSRENSGRLDLANAIARDDNPLTARVFVNRVWGQLMGSYLVDTPSDFGLQGSRPTHPALLDWLAADFIENGWSLKRLVRMIVMSETYRQSSRHRAKAAAIDVENDLFWRANRKRLTVEAMRDATLAVVGELDRTERSRPRPLWGEDYTKRRAVYGFVDRFNIDPTLRAFDVPAPTQTVGSRTENTVPQQALFAMNSPFMIDQARALVRQEGFIGANSRVPRIEYLFERVLQRAPSPEETERVGKFVAAQARVGNQAWPLVAQSLLMSNEFIYLD